MDKQIELFCTAVFCVAWADGAFSIEEKRKAKNKVAAFLATATKENQQEKLALIDATFEDLERMNCRGEKCFERLEKRIQSMQEFLDVRMRKELIDCCIGVASATNRLNKSELVLLSRLENLLK